MKKINRFLSLVLAAVLVLSLAIVVSAAETTKITIKDSDSVTVAEKTFKAYKILDATYAGGNASNGAAYTVPPAMKDFFAERYRLDSRKADFHQKVAEKIAAEPDLLAFAKAALAAAKSASIKPATATAGIGVRDVEINNLPVGYYVIEDAGKQGDTGAPSVPISALMVDNAGAEITMKADRPSLDKKIDGNKDTDPGTDGMMPVNNAAIGDKVPFVLTSKVPDMKGYDKYFFVVEDTLSQGLTFCSLHIIGLLRTLIELFCHIHKLLFNALFKVNLVRQNKGDHFITADPTNDGVRRQDLLEPVGNGHNGKVTFHMTVEVVDLLQMIQIAENQIAPSALIVSV